MHEQSMLHEKDFLIFFLNVGNAHRVKWYKRERKGVNTEHSPFYEKNTMGRRYLLSTAVEDQEVGLATETALDGVLGGGRLEGGVDLGSALGLTGTKVQSGDTGNVGSGHGSSGDGVAGSLGSNPGRGDLDTRSKDLNALAEGREGGNVVVDIRGTDGQSLRGTGGRTRASVDVLVVTGGDNDRDVGTEKAANGIVQGAGGTTTKRHVDDGLLALVDADDPVKSSDDSRGGTRTLTVEDLDTDEVDLLGNTVGVSSDGTGDVGTVTVLVGVGRALDEVVAHLGTAAKVDMGGVDTSINNVGGHTSSGRVGILVRGTLGDTTALGDTGETPGGGRLLGADDGDDRVLLDIIDLVVLEELIKGSTVTLDGETGDGLEAMVDLGGLAAVATVLDAVRELVEFGLERVDGVGVLEDDDVLVGDRVGLVVAVGDEGAGVGSRAEGQDGNNEEGKVLHFAGFVGRFKVVRRRRGGKASKEKSWLLWLCG